MPTSSKSSPFDFVKSINEGSRGSKLEVDEGYLPFIINRAMSNFSDTVFFANEMNRCSHLDKELQYDFLRNITRPKRRFSKWAKKLTQTPVQKAMIEVFGISYTKACEYEEVLTEDEKKLVLNAVEKGGITKKKL